MLTLPDANVGTNIAAHALDVDWLQPYRQAESTILNFS
jgi:hypothetical protein